MPNNRSRKATRHRNHLVLSKLTPPRPSPFQVMRAALRDRICLSASEKVVLIQAPAGFGKSTVMLQVMALLEKQGTPASWMTVDAADNDIGRFVSFLTAAFEQLMTDDDDASDGAEAVGLVALDLIDRVAGAQAPFALFIDDLESIQNPAVLALVRQVIENLPPGGRLVIGSRTLPDIGSARLLAKGQLLQIDPLQLRFSIGEASDFLQVKRGLKLQGTQITRLHRTTEGWPAALWLASVALDRREHSADPAADLVGQFSGTNAAVADYFAEEVLARQPAELRDFMLRTSILGQLCAPLCDAVRGKTDSRDILERLHRANLFVEPVSDDREWFRYHSLFSSFLRVQLERTAPHELPALHRAAAAWYEAQRRPIPAIEHALASGEAAYALPLLARHADSLLGEGRVRLLVRLLDSVPADDLLQWPKLRLTQVWALSFTRGAQDAMRMLERLEADGELDDVLKAHAFALRPMLLTMLDRFEEAYAVGQANLDRVRAGQMFPYSILRTSLANLLMVLGKYSSARELLDKSRVEQGSPTGPFMMIFAQCVEGVIDLLHGRLRQATARFRISAGADSRNVSTYTNGNAMAGILLSEVLYEANEINEAERLLSVYVPLMQELGMCDHLISGHRNLVRIAAHRGDQDRALQAVTEMEYFGHRMGLSRLVASAQLERARLALTQNDIRAAREALQRARAAEDWSQVMQRSLFGNDADTLTEGHLRWMIHSGAAAEAVPLLKQELERAETAKRQRRALKFRILLSLSLDRAGNEKAAMRMLRDALRFGASERFVRTFLDEGELFQQLLHKLLAAQQLEPDESLALDTAQYFDRLSATTPLPGGGVIQHTGTGSPVAESLTRKELEILRLLAEGLPNSGIAGRLFVSETTVRTHLRNINAKFQVHNRTQAIALGRKLGLIG